MSEENQTPGQDGKSLRNIASEQGITSDTIRKAVTGLETRSADRETWNKQADKLTGNTKRISQEIEAVAQAGAQKKAEWQDAAKFAEESKKRLSDPNSSVNSTGVPQAKPPGTDPQ